MMEKKIIIKAGDHRRRMKKKAWNTPYPVPEGKEWVRIGILDYSKSDTEGVKVQLEQGFDYKPDARELSGHPECDICHQGKRGLSMRRVLYLYQNLQTGEVKKVGDECLNKMENV